MQFIKHVEPKFISPLRPIVSLALTCRRRGFANMRFVSLGVGIHGVQLRLLCKSLASSLRLTAAISLHRVSYTKSRHELQKKVPWDSSKAIECFLDRKWDVMCDPGQYVMEICYKLI